MFSCLKQIYDQRKATHFLEKLCGTWQHLGVLAEKQKEIKIYWFYYYRSLNALAAQSALWFKCKLEKQQENLRDSRDFAQVVVRSPFNSPGS